MKDENKRPLKILVVDDEPDVCDIMGDFLRDRGYDVVTALTRDEGITALTEKKPQIALLDIRLKGASGLEVLKSAREMSDDIIVIMITALDDESTVKEARSLGADDYIVKPLTLDYLENVVLRKISLLTFRKKSKGIAGEEEQ